MENKIFEKPISIIQVIQFIVGIVAVVTSIVTAIAVFPVLISGHPAYLVLLIFILVIGILFSITALKTKKRGKKILIVRTIGMFILIFLLAISIYLKPFSSKERGIASVNSTDKIEVVEYWDRWELHPKGETNNVGLVFLQGMLVDSRAYIPLLIPAVEEGTTVIVPKVPLGMIINGAQTTEKAIESYPEIITWVVGGHSMGGATAATVAKNNPNIDGLLIWASYSTDDMSDSSIDILSIYGTNDPFANEEIINDTKKYLPDTTEYIAILGGIHEHFADYTQSGDGVPEIDREDAEKQIIQETLKFIESLSEKEKSS